MSLTRLTDHSGDIQDFTAEQLSEIKLTGSHDVILTLENIMNKVDQRYPVLIEIKGDQGQPEQISRAVFNDTRDYSGPVAIMSFFPDIVLWFRQNAPQVPRGLVATTINDGGLPEEYFSALTQKSLVDSLDVDFIAYDIKALPNQVTEYCRGKTIPVLTWTVRTRQQQKKARQYTDNIIYENQV